MKRVVADTNILVSALQFGGKPKQLLDLAVDGHVDLAASEAIIAETLRVLRDKFERAPEWLAEADRQLRVITRLVQPTESILAIEADPNAKRSPETGDLSLQVQSGCGGALPSWATAIYVVAA